MKNVRDNNSEVFDVVLYYNRKISVKPSMPKFENLYNKNSNMTIDELLDNFSDMKKKFENDLYKYVENGDTIYSYVFIKENENFIKNVKEFENNDFFVSWSESSKTLIKEISLNILNS